MKTSLRIVAAARMATAGAAQAALVDRGGGMIHDTTFDITWLADMNQAQTGGVGADGRMSWVDAVQWADALVHGGFDDSRLPTLDAHDTSCSSSTPGGAGFGLQHSGHGCTGGELSHLFVADFGNEAGTSVFDLTGDGAAEVAHLALFANVQSEHCWSGTPYAPDPGPALGLRNTDGFQGFGDKETLMAHVVAVRDGVVVIGMVPEPPAFALALMALGASTFGRGRRAAPEVHGDPGSRCVRPAAAAVHLPARRDHRSAGAARRCSMSAGVL